MTLIFVVENRLGIRFNKRRVSRDSVLCLRIENLAKDAKLWVSPYSARLFPNAQILGENSQIADEDFVFVEENEILLPPEKIERIYLYRWNRDYPFDEQLAFDFDDYEIISTVDFQGKAHEMITEEVYEKIRKKTIQDEITVSSADGVAGSSNSVC